ncbi:DUF2442 domain-containing protein [Desulfuromonas sp. TF]|jgi:hypothetical protein|uniref:DUF2442 domain-containing protein n=1 Tax=Desulfuromonas sp. TF TaxID=1232410 RepID=UPI00040EAA29|nr:DUF2442 domain-containing protein [Desulfuromonas sp. TF]
MESVVRVVPRENYQLEIEFRTGEVRLFDVRPYLDKGVFSQLKDQALFARAFVAFDTVCWPNNLDIAPETLYVKSVPISSEVHEKPEEYGECP